MLLYSENGTAVIILYYGKYIYKYINKIIDIFINIGYNKIGDYKERRRKDFLYGTDVRYGADENNCSHQSF